MNIDKSEIFKAMKKTQIIVAILAFVFIANAQTKKPAVGDSFPFEKTAVEKKQADNTIVAFMPSLSSECDYASMLTQSFYYYFVERLAFENLPKSPRVQIVLIVNDKRTDKANLKNITTGMDVVFDEKGEIFSSFGVSPPTNKNADSTVILLDSKNTVSFADENYRSQGEHLKPLENKLKDLNGIYFQPKPVEKMLPLKVGAKAPDFRVDDKTMLSDLKGRVVLISFYPAAFSGTLPKPVEPVPSNLEIFRINPNSGIRIDSNRGMSCDLQLDGLDVGSVYRTEKRIVISASTNSLLEKWQNVLDTSNIQYANDPDYSVSKSYGSYNQNGYNNRVSVIVDRKGKIAFIDDSFEYNDETVINAKIEELLRKKK